jgi:hypothetical protein
MAFRQMDVRPKARVHAEGASSRTAQRALILSTLLTAHGASAAAVHAQSTPLSVVEPTDPGAVSQWYLADAEPGVFAYTAWGMLRDVPKHEVSVAVVDTNIELWSNDLKSRLVPGWDVRNNRPYGNNYLIGASLHGTWVAGTIAAESNNGVFGSGVAGDLPVKIMPLLYVNEGDMCGGALRPEAAEDVGRAFAGSIAFALEHGAKVINVSSAVLITPEVASQYEPLIRAARDQGVLIVAASGNHDLDMRKLEQQSVVAVTLRDVSKTPSNDPCSQAGKSVGFRYEDELDVDESRLLETGASDIVNIDGKTYERSVTTLYPAGTKSYPAAYSLPPFNFDNVLGVTGSNREGTRWVDDCSFLDGRPVICGGGTYGDHARLVAPAYDIPVYSGFGIGLTTGGTSFAAPIVSAAAAMLWSVAPELSVAEVVTALTAGTDTAAIQRGEVGPKDVLRLPRALEALGFEDALAPRRMGQLSEPTWNAELRRNELVDDVTFDPNGHIVERIWDWGDGTRTITGGDAVTASHAYPYKGNYPVTLTVIDDDGNTLSFTQTLAMQGSTRDLVTLTLEGEEPYRLEGVLQEGNIRNYSYFPSIYFMRGAGTLLSEHGEVEIEINLKTGWFGSSPGGTITISDPVRGVFVVSIASGTMQYEKSTDTLTFAHASLSDQPFTSVAVTVRDTDD